jgi:hypothetical protein
MNTKKVQELLGVSLTLIKSETSEVSYLESLLLLSELAEQSQNNSEEKGKELSHNINVVINEAKDYNGDYRIKKNILVIGIEAIVNGTGVIPTIENYLDLIENPKSRLKSIVENFNQSAKKLIEEQSKIQKQAEELNISMEFIIRFNSEFSSSNFEHFEYYEQKSL